MMGQQILPTLLWDILSILDSTSQSLITTSDDTYNPIARNTKGWRQFTCIEHTKSSARSCSHIEEPAASLHSWFDGFHKGLNLRKNLAYSLSHQGIFLVDVPQDFAYRHPFQMVELRRLLSYLVF